MSRTLALLAGLLPLAPALVQASTNDILIGLDEKVVYDAGVARTGPGGKDALLVLDVSNPAEPKIRASLPLANSLLGPPTNLQITPDGKLALLANSVVTQEKNGAWTSVPDDKLYVVDLEANPPKLIDTVTVGKQPSGLAISHDGKLALIANRAGKSISVLAIDAASVKQVAEVPMEDEVAAVAITPDGKRAFAAKNTVAKVAVLAIDGQKVTYDKALDLPAGFGVYNIDVTPDGHYAIVANTGGGTAGNMHTVMTVDSSANPPRVISWTTVGDGPEGLAVSPDGKWAGVPLLKGTGSKPDAWNYTKEGGMVLVRIGDGGKLEVVNELSAGRLAEGVAFSPDSQYVYIGNYSDRNLQIYRIENGKLTDTGKKLDLPGQPASMRGPAR